MDRGIRARGAAAQVGRGGMDSRDDRRRTPGVGARSTVRGKDDVRAKAIEDIMVRGVGVVGRAEGSLCERSEA